MGGPLARSASAPVLLVTLTIAGCATRAPHPPVPAAVRHPDYIDLQPGWSVRVVTPLTKSGKYKVETTPIEATGNTLTLKATDDLLGYEEDFYEVRPLAKGVTIRFQSATTHLVNGTSAKRQQPVLPLLQIPENTPYVRLLFLTCESRTDYDGAILAGASPAVLDAMTRQVEEDPAQGCMTEEQSMCRWIPLGISVQPQPNSTRR